MKVWESKLDELYQCEVERTEPHKGRLTMKDSDGNLLINEEVSLAFDAEFGADVMDIQDWQERCSEVADQAAEQRTGTP